MATHASRGSSSHMKPPNWDEDQGPKLRAVCIFFIVFTSLFVIVRLTSQIQVHRRLFWDDTWLTLSLLFMCGVQGVDLWGLNNGLGKHVSRVIVEDPSPPSHFIILWQVGFSNSILIYLCLYTVKLSLLLLYKRLFWIARWFRLFWYSNLAYASLWVVAVTLVAVFQCTPIDYAWNRMYLLTHIPAPFKIEGTCVNQYFVTASSSLSLVSDVGIWLLPMIAIFKLQMTKKRKIEMGLLLSLGLIAVACGTVKTIIANAALTSKDVSWANAPLATWASAEEAVGILCAAIPVIVGNFRAIRAVRRNKGRPGHNAYYEQSKGSSAGPARSVGSRRTRHGNGNTVSTDTSTAYGYGSDKSVVSNLSKDGGIARGGRCGTGGGSRYEDDEFAQIIEMEQRGGVTRHDGVGRCGECGARGGDYQGPSHEREDSRGEMEQDVEMQRPPRRGADFV